MNFLDRAIGFLSPEAGVRRAINRRKIELLSRRGYEAAQVGRHTSSGRHGKGGADAEIGRSARTLRQRSEDLVRNNPLAAKIVTAHANNIVGYGIRPRAQVGTEAQNAVVDDLFTKWSAVCFSGGAMDFHGGIYLLARMMIQDGEAYVRRRARRIEDGLPVPLQLQIMDADFCDWSQIPRAGTANPVIQGVEFDLIGNRRGYWMYPQNPRGVQTLQSLSIRSAFVPATDVAHIYEPQSNQVHGVPWLTPAMNDLDETRDYEVSENIRKRTESCMVGMVVRGATESEDPNIGLTEPPEGGEAYDAEGPQVPPRIADIYGNPVERMEPGMFITLDDGSDVRFNTPAISAGIEGYLRTRHRTIASGVRLPYELLTGDFSQSNFASGKLGLLEYQRFVMVVQWHYMVPQLLNRVWGWFVEAAKDSGKIPRSWDVGVEWDPPEVESITRLDDARADLLEVRMGKRSMKEVISRTGRSPKKVLKETDEWNADVDATPTGVILDSDPRRVSNNGQIQSLASTGGDGNG